MSLIVGDDFRTHPWSHTPGGVTVCVQYDYHTRNNCLKYTKVKDPNAFTNATLRNHNDVKKIWIHNTNEILFELS